MGIGVNVRGIKGGVNVRGIKGGVNVRGIKGGVNVGGIKGGVNVRGAYLFVISSTAARLFPFSCSELQCQSRKFKHTRPQGAHSMHVTRAGPLRSCVVWHAQYMALCITFGPVQ